MLTGAIIAGIVFGLYYTLVGLGLNLVFGVMRIVNLAHGDFLMLGGIAAWFLFSSFGLHPLVAAGLVIVVFLLAGLPIYYLVVPRLLRSRDSEMLSLILFFGVSQMIEASAPPNAPCRPVCWASVRLFCSAHDCPRPGSSVPPPAPSPSCWCIYTCIAPGLVP
jgi:hypothetical protein